ncbi:MAG: nicotinate phosphoribosyltransferase [Clostridiales bacterium]|nr:nicotinate phosphoribosyltransferase [Clostridiales bacterium]
MRNLTMLTDLYELTMLSGYRRHGMEDRQAVFYMFYRGASELSYAVMAGNEQFKDYVLNLHFSPEDIGYLRSLNIFEEGFLKSLADFRFEGDIDIMPEGAIVFPGEPMVRVRAPLSQAQLIESAMLNLIGHQTLIATKGNRVARAAKGDRVMEFGLRRAQGPDAGVLGARAAVIGGCYSTSNVMAGQHFGIPVSGTHAHSWVMSFESELAAFRAYAQDFPNSCLLLVDTYDTLRSGVPNAIKVFEELKAQGMRPLGIRLDSGDLAYLSKEARRMLDAAGFPDTIIVASNDLDEFLIRDLKQQGARIDLWGVGTKLITSAGRFALGGVYKMSALEEDGKLVPKMKMSDNPEKITLPGDHEVYRLYDQDNMAIADLIALKDEVIDFTQPLTIFHPQDTWKKMRLENYSARKLLTPLIRAGQAAGKNPSLLEIKRYREQEEATIWEQHLRLVNPQPYKVDLSDRLWQLREDLIHGQEDGREG